MKILFAIAVFSFAALVWVAFAIMRHVRKNSAKAAFSPAAEAEMSQAIDVRLSSLARTPPVGQRTPLVSEEAQHDRAYFDKQTASAPHDRTHYPEPPAKPSAGEHS
jgi:hypothetical protein